MKGNMTTMSRPPAEPSELHHTRRQRLASWLLLGLQDSKGSSR
jgi:hypothetical protein